MTVETCGRCRQLVPAGAKRCASCGRLYPTLFGQRRRLDALFSRDVSWSRGLCLFLVLVYLATVVASQWIHDTDFSGARARLAPGARVLIMSGLLIPDRALGSEWWRLVLANFLHLNFLHILFNASALLTLGRLVESMFGPARFTQLFVLGGAAANLFSAEFDRGGAGSSAGIAALLGAILAFGIRRKGNVGNAIKQQAIQWIALMAVFGLAVDGVNNHAHFGGCLAGFLMAYTFDLRQHESGRESDAARIGALGSILLVVVSAALAVVRGVQGYPW